MVINSLSLFLLQVCAGGLFFLFFTTRLRLVGIGYGWLLRGTYVSLLVIAALLSGYLDNSTSFIIGSIGLGVLILIAILLSVMRRSAGVSGQNLISEKRSKRVADMTGIETTTKEKETGLAEFNPNWDLACSIFAFGFLLVLSMASDPSFLQMLRILVGALFLGAVTDAMLLGHWYLVQPGLPRQPLKEITYANVILLLVTVVFWLVGRSSMISVFTGEIDDGYGGLLGWFWIASAATSGILLIMAIMALKEKAYSAVMAATGLLYLAILTAYSIEIIANRIIGS